MSATVAAALKKIAIYILGDRLSSARQDKRGKLFVLIESIAVGFIGRLASTECKIATLNSMPTCPPLLLTTAI